MGGNICWLVSHMLWTVVVLHAVYWLVTQSCLTLCDPMDCSLEVSLSMGFSRQEYKMRVAISFSKCFICTNLFSPHENSSWKRDNFTLHLVTTETEARTDHKLLPWSHTALNRRQKFERGQLKVKAYVFTYSTPLLWQLCSPLDQWSGFSCWIIAWVKVWALLNANVRGSNVSFWRCLYLVQRDLAIVLAVYGRDPKRKCLKETWKLSSLLGKVQGGQISLLCKAVRAQVGASVSELCCV